MNSKIACILFLTIHYVNSSPKRPFVNANDIVIRDVNMPLEWRLAKQNCQINGEIMPYLRSPNMNKILTSVLKKADLGLTTLWIAGIEDPIQKKKYYWEYSENERYNFSYANWKADEPKELSEQACVVIDTSSEGQDGFKWAVEPCLAKNRYICVASR